MILARVYDEGADIGVRFEPGDHVMVRVRRKDEVRIVPCKVVQTGDGPFPTLALRPCDVTAPSHVTRE